ncbi:hypothetical protein SAMN06295885_0118 [Rathayibacter oskolensis]|uniref:Uncharacterized protein n=1 Tax=Rathayibacter oskolensis TaxID=1891671 RepID=A0A1X7MUB3_9MICO|nr:DUF6518 family protein [Rathayibacter oskolensis]SMH28237.1 hypothetical protein SAMN06295885_0118 [Rathayibacter oskolensis]
MPSAPARRPHAPHLLRGLVLAVVGGLVLGGLTSLLQSSLPFSVTAFANSSGGWSMLVFALVRLGGVRPVAGAVLGLLSFWFLLEGYDLVTAWRGFGYSPPFTDLFWLLAVPAGPILGAAAALTRHGSNAWRVLAVAPLSGVLSGEGVWALGAIAETTSPVYWWIEIVLGVGFLSLAVIRRRPRGLVVLGAVAVTAAAAAAFVAVYSLA